MRTITPEEQEAVDAHIVKYAKPAGVIASLIPVTCGVWGGNITNENISLKHYMSVTWVSRPIPEDRPSEEELFGEFFNSAVLEAVGAQ